jgi:hypothetical protein
MAAGGGAGEGDMNIQTYNMYTCMCSKTVREGWECRIDATPGAWPAFTQPPVLEVVAVQLPQRPASAPPPRVRPAQMRET